MTHRLEVRYTADALYPEYKTARLETTGEDMTNQKRRIEDNLPTEPLQWDEDSANDEILSLHRQLAAEKMRADRAESRADAKSQECIELRERMAARQGGITSEENGAGDLTDEQILPIETIVRLIDENTDRDFGLIVEPFARAIERAAIAAHLARQPKAEQRGQFEAQARLAGHTNFMRMAGDPETYDDLILRAEYRGWCAALARQAQAQPEGWMLAPKPRGRQSLAYLIQQASLACIENRVMEPDDRHEFAQYADLIRNSPVAPASAQNAQQEAELSTLEHRLDEMQAIIRAGSYWNGNEQSFADKTESDVAMLDDLLSDAFRLLRATPTSTAAAPADAQNALTVLLKLLGQLENEPRRMRHTPGTGQNHAYLDADEVAAHVEEARKALATSTDKELSMADEQPDENGLIFGDVPAVREFKVWLNDQRMNNVSYVFHAIVAKFRAAVAKQGSVQKSANASVLEIPTAIMNIAVDPRQSEEYRRGHRDARHQAADLVLARADELAALAATKITDSGVQSAQQLANVIDYLVANGHMEWRGFEDDDEAFSSNNAEFQAILDLVKQALEYKSSAQNAEAIRNAATDEEIHQRVRDAVAGALTGLYYCDRVWSAWSVGTMSEDDFSPADEDDDIIENVTSAAIRALQSGTATSKTGEAE